MQIDEIIQRVKDEVGEASTTTPDGSSGGKSSRQEPGLEIRGRYHIQELLSIDREALVTSVYRCLLRRAPDPAAENYSKMLASGALTPVALIGKVRYSSEGRQVGTIVEGLLPRMAFYYLKKIPLLGSVLKVGWTLLRLPSITRDIDEDISSLRTGLSLKADSSELERKADRAELERKADRVELERKASRADLERKADRSEVLAYRDAVRYAELYFHRVSEELQAVLGEQKENLPTAPEQVELVHERVSALSAEVYDKLYLDFESLYRGTQQEVSDALTAYADLFASLGSTPGTPKRAIDLGSGRGEMLRYLGQQGYEAIGVDLNQLAVSSCVDEGLNAICADALTYLESLEPESVSLVTSLHMIEHLQTRDLLYLLQAALKVLKPGGMLLLETPNPRNLLVGSGDFYRDFTHNKPLFPDTLRFLLDYFGYAQAETLFFEDAGRQGRKPVSAGDVQFNDLSDYLEVSRDYAVVGYKRCG